MDGFLTTGGSETELPRAIGLVQGRQKQWQHGLVHPLDLLGTIEETAGFPELVGDSDWIDLGVARARVLSLERLIQIKQRLGRPKFCAARP